MISQIALRLICGMGLTWCVMPRGAVTAGFFRIQMLVTLGLSVLTAMTVSQPDGGSAEEAALLGVGALRAIGLLLAIISFVGSVFWTLARRQAGLVCCVQVAVLGVVGLIGRLPVVGSATSSGFLLSAASELSSAWLFGGATTAMLLGHWYLTATGMSLDPLIRLTQLLLVAAVLRGVLAVVGIVTLPESAASVTAGVHGIWLLLRWAAGIAGPLILALMTRRILRYRNTQSATGVLFAAVILVFIGETTAALLFRDFQWPL